MTEGSLKLVVGVGNPGREYEHTRHNVGFDVVDVLAKADRIEVSKRRFEALAGEGNIASRRVMLMKPQTFVNLSGRAVRQAVDFYKMDVADVLIVCDDANLPPGKIRFRRDGSSGGHHGLDSVIACLGTEQFARLRVGIGRREGDDLVDHVLGRFSSAERKVMEESLIEAVRGVSVWLTKGIDECMNEFNG